MKRKQDEPVYLPEAAKMLGTTHDALRVRVHRMMNEGSNDCLIKPYLDNSTSRERWAFNRADLAAFVRAKKRLSSLSQ